MEKSAAKSKFSERWFLIQAKFQIRTPITEMNHQESTGQEINILQLMLAPMLLSVFSISTLIAATIPLKK